MQPVCDTLFPEPVLTSDYQMGSPLADVPHLGPLVRIVLHCLAYEALTM